MEVQIFHICRSSYNTLVTDINISKIKTTSHSRTEQQEFCCLYYVCVYVIACVRAYACPYKVCSPSTGYERSRLSSSICIPPAYRRLDGPRTTLIGHVH
jgi:hypothetical protein